MNNINIIYSLENNIQFSMWSYFFKSCGVWVKSQTSSQYRKNIQKKIYSEKKTSLLYILAKNDSDLIKKCERNHTVYLVSKPTLEMYSEEERNDIFSSRVSKSKKTISLILQKLSDQSNGIDLWQAFQLFSRYKLWGNSWLFHEINDQSEAEWNLGITNSCMELYHALNQQIQKTGLNSYNSFMRIYCRYIGVSVQEIEDKAKNQQVTELMRMSHEYIDKFGFDASIFYLMGKICGLSRGEYKTALFFYLDIAKEDRTPELLYTIGREYEKRYNNMEKAFQFYKESYEIDNNYRAQYKLALVCNENGNWKQALTHYSDILNAIQNAKDYDSINISAIEYEYKVTLRMAMIYKNVIQEERMVDSARRYLVRLFQGLGNRKDFDKILRHMFGKAAPQIKNQLWEEVEKKFQTSCFANNIL